MASPTAAPPADVPAAAPPAAPAAPATAHTQGTPVWIPVSPGADRQLYAQVLPGPHPNAPTVVFEAGAMATRSSWALVQPRVAKFARAVVYDRSGFGRSPPDWDDRSMARMSGDLAQVLDHFARTDAVGGDRDPAAAAGSFVLVGHSLGGPIVRAAAPLRAELLRGVLLVDPTDERLAHNFTPAFQRRMWWINNIAWAASYVMSGLRLVGLPAPRGPFGWMRDACPPDVQADLDAEMFTPTGVNTGIAQAASWMDELRVWESDPAGRAPAAPAVPVTIVSGAKEEESGPKIFDRAEVNVVHAQRAAEYKDGRHVVATNSGHYSLFTDVDLLVDEIRRLAVPSA